MYSSIVGIVCLVVRNAASYAGAPVFGNMIIAYVEAFSWEILLLLYLIRLFWKNRQPYFGKNIP